MNPYPVPWYSSPPSVHTFHSPNPIPMMLNAQFSALLQIMHSYCDTQAENEHLRAKLQQNAIKDEAFRHTVDLGGQYTCTNSPSGRLLEIMEPVVETAIHVIPSPPTKLKPYYLIRLKGIPDVLRMEEAHFQNDALFIGKLEEVPGVSIKYARSTKTTANLLRSAIRSKMTHLPLSCYGGWVPDQNLGFQFVRFPSGSTCCRDEEIPVPLPLSETTPSAASMAAQLFWPAFTLFQAHSDRVILFLWFHVAALFSLLPWLETDFPVWLCLFSENEDCVRCLTELLQWDGTPVVSLSLPKAGFAETLLFQKDQPLLIADTPRDDNASANAQTLRQVLLTRQISWNKASYPLRAPVCFLFSTPSDLTCLGGGVTLDIAGQDFDRTLSLPTSNLAARSRDYRDHFLGFTQTQLGSLRKALEAGEREAQKLVQEPLIAPCAQSFGVLLGIAKFLQTFFAYCDVVEPPIDLQDPQWKTFLLGRLTESSEKGAYRAGLVPEFLALARSMLERHSLPLYAKDRAPTSPPVNAVYFDDHTLAFSPNAMLLICQQLGYSRPSVLNVLDQSGLLTGVYVNRTTWLSRLRVVNAYGAHSTINAYLLNRDAFDQIGDPFLCEEVTVCN